MTVGTVLPKVRAQLIELLSARAGLAGVLVSYSVPKSGEQLEAGEAVFFPSESSGVIDNLALRALPLLLSETWQQGVVCQVLPPDDSYDQQTAETRAAELAGEVIDEVAGDPSLGLSVDEWGRIIARPVEWAWESGLADNGGWLARATVTLQIEADRS